MPLVGNTGQARRQTKKGILYMHLLQLQVAGICRIARDVSAAFLLALAFSPVHASSDGGTLQFDAARFTRVNVTVDGEPVVLRVYSEICYVGKPVKMAAVQVGLSGAQTQLANPACGYQSMNVVVPEAMADNPQTAIYFVVGNSGWMASYIRASISDGASYNSASSNVGAALKAGFVVVEVASRSRGLVAADGSFPGKAPAVVVDAKAAVRYLRLNDAVMPGTAERIVVNGTSGGGGMSAILGASGNSSDFFPYLAEIGAAGIDARGRSTIRDDVFAINAYCPITDLGNADLAYEWLFNTLGTRKTVNSNPDPHGSAEIAAKFPAYEKSLKLTNYAGKSLTADNMLAQVQHEVTRAAEAFMNAAPGNTIPGLGEAMTFAARVGGAARGAGSAAAGVGGLPTGGAQGGTPVALAAAQSQSFINDWLDVDNANRKVLSIDMEKYLKFLATQATLKPVPAFDSTGVSTYTGNMGESNLFGASNQKYSNYTEFTWNHNDTQGDGVGQDDTGMSWSKFVASPKTMVDDQVKHIDPMRYIGTAADTAPYWYVRHGTRDRDTAFIVSINLSRALAADKNVKNVNYRLAWNQPHAGNYDVPEAMQWIARILVEAGPVAERR